MDENSHGSITFASDIASHKHIFLSAPKRISELARGEWRRGRPAAEIRGGNEQKGVRTGETGGESNQEREVGSSTSNEGGGGSVEEEKRERDEFSDICMTTKAEGRRSREKGEETKVKREEKGGELERKREGRNKKDVMQEKKEKGAKEKREDYCIQAKISESSPSTSWKKKQSLSPNPQSVHNKNKEKFDHLQSVQTSLQVIYACGSFITA